MKATLPPPLSKLTRAQREVLMTIHADGSIYMVDHYAPRDKLLKLGLIEVRSNSSAIYVLTEAGVTAAKVLEAHDIEASKARLT